MRKSCINIALLGAVLVLPSIALAQDPVGGAAAGAAGGAAAGAAVGGPAGAAVGAGVGAAAGAGAGVAGPPREHVYVAPGPEVSDRTCVTDGAGNRSCTEVRH
jgi:hypothetical protein